MSKFDKIGLENGDKIEIANRKHYSPYYIKDDKLYNCLDNHAVFAEYYLLSGSEFKKLS